MNSDFAIVLDRLAIAMSSSGFTLSRQAATSKHCHERVCGIIKYRRAPQVSDHTAMSLDVEAGIVHPAFREWDIDWRKYHDVRINAYPINVWYWLQSEQHDLIDRLMRKGRYIPIVDGMSAEEVLFAADVMLFADKFKEIIGRAAFERHIIQLCKSGHQRFYDMFAGLAVATSTDSVPLISAVYPAICNCQDVTVRRSIRRWIEHFEERIVSASPCVTEYLKRSGLPQV